MENLFANTKLSFKFALRSLSARTLTKISCCFVYSGELRLAKAAHLYC